MKVDIHNPKTEADYVYITMLLWFDIYKNNYISKIESKYFCLVKYLISQCGCCAYISKTFADYSSNFPNYSCKNCFLSSYNCEDGEYKCGLWSNWIHSYNWFNSSIDSRKYAKEIYNRCRDRFYDLCDLDK